MLFKIRKFINPPYSIKEIFSIIGLLVVLSSAPIALIITTRESETKAQESMLRYTDVEIAERSTLSILKTRNEYKRANESEKQKIKKELAGLIKARNKLLTELAVKNPEAVLRVSIPTYLSTGIPSESKINLEQPTAVQGELEILHIDKFDEKNSDFVYFLRTGKTRYELHPTQKIGERVSGKKIKIFGVKIGNHFVFNPETTENSKVLAASLDTIGDQKVAVILVNFQNNTSQPFNKAFAADMVFNTVNSYYKENSFNKASLSGEVFGWYTLPVNQTCTYSTIQNEAIKAADPDIFFPNYKKILFLFPMSPSNTCGWAGLGTVGKWGISTGDGTVSASMSWIVAAYFNLRVTGHELGHNLGVWHANAWECGTVSVRGSCTSAEYGDIYDIMGTSIGHFNAYHKEAFGWFDTANVQTVSSNTTVTLEPIESASTNIQIVKIPKDKDANGNPTSYYYLEYRQPIGFDAGLAPSGYHNVFDGILIHFAPTVYGSGDTHLIDATPDSVGGSTDRFDSALTTSKTFIDSSAGVEIKTRNKILRRLLLT